MRLNKEIRKSIIDAALKGKFADKIEQFQQRKKTIGDMIYKCAVPGKPPSVDPEWVLFIESVNLSAFGFERKARQLMDIRGSLKHGLYMLHDEGFSLTKPSPAPRRFRYSAYVGVQSITKGVKDALTNFYDDAKAVMNKYEELESDLRDLLNSVNTYRQLEAAWPEGKPIYEKFKPKPRTTAVIDAGLTKKITAALTPPLAAK